MRKISVCAIVCVLLSIFLLSGCANDQEEAKVNADGVVLQHETRQNGTIIQQIMIDTNTGYTYLYTYTYDRVGLEEVCRGVSITIIDDKGVIRETITNSW
jgi:PBP1b-binding outer membrane lipoprotein LpoB